MVSKHRRLRYALGVLAIIAMCAVVVLLLERSRARAVEELRRDTSNLTTALSLNTRAIVASIDLALAAARDNLALLEATAQRPPSARVGDQVLRDAVSRIGLPVLVRVLDARGFEQYTSSGERYPASSAERDFFSVHIGGETGLYISPPFVSRINGQWAMVFSRRISGPDGAFKGVVVVGTPVKTFEHLFERYQLGELGSLILANDDGILVARWPRDPQLIGKKFLRDDGALGQLRRGINSGVRINPGPDGVMRMRGFERVGTTRLVVGVGQSVDEWLANWRREAIVSGTVAALLAGLALFMLFRTALHDKVLTASHAKVQRSEERIRAILEQAPSAFISIDSQGMIREWNRQAEATFGWRADEVLGRPVAEVIIPERMRKDHAEGLRAFSRTGTGPLVNQHIELLGLHQDGREIPVEVSMGALQTPDGWVANAFLHDIAERRAATAKLAAVNRRLREIADRMPALVSYVDDEGYVRFCNRTWHEWLGVEPASVVGRTLADVLGSTMYEQRREQFEHALAGQRVTLESESVAAGVNRYLQTVYIPDVQADGAVEGVYIVSTDVTDAKRVEMQLQDLAHVDPLTGLANRRRFEQHLQDALARSARTMIPAGLMYLDIDRFKSINDSHGHATGDAVLKEFARRLQACVRLTDIVSRLAGDEFTVILEGLQSDGDAEVIAGKILDAMLPPFELGGISLQVTSSIGVAVAHGDTSSAQQLLAKADEALYDAKRAGRARFVIARLGEA